MARPQAQLDRVLAALTIGVHQSVKHRRLALEDTRTGPKHQLVQVPISGQAGNGWGYATPDHRVSWELPFLYAPGQWLVPFSTPHFQASFAQISGLSDLILFHAHVIGWRQTEEGWFVGATVRFASCAPNAASTVPWSGMAHLTFSGYAALAEVGEFDK